MTDPDNPSRRTIEPNRALDPTYAKPPPWFVGGGKGLMIGVLTIVAVLIGLRIVSTGYLVAEGYRWWRAPIPTVLPKTLPVATTPASPLGNPGAWFAADDYPPAARRASQEGRVSVSLLIGTDGSPIACEVTTGSGFTSLDEATCRLSVRHGRFRPALDGQGRAVEARFRMPGVRWKLDH